MTEEHEVEKRDIYSRKNNLRNKLGRGLAVASVATSAFLGHAFSVNAIVIATHPVIQVIVGVVAIGSDLT